MRKTDAEQEFPPEETPGAPPDPNSPSERFYGAAITRIVRGILVLGIAGTGGALAAYGVRTGVSFFVGAALAYWNFHSLVSAVKACTAAAPSTRSGRA